MDVYKKEVELLIKKITSEVVNKMITETMENNGEIDGIVFENKKILALVPDFTVDLVSYLRFLKDKHEGYEIVIGAYSSIDDKIKSEVNEIVNLNEKSSKEKISSMRSEFEYTYLISPSISMLEAITEGNDKEYFEMLILYNILHEKNTGIIIDYDIRNLKPTQLTRKIEKLLSQISEMKISIDLLCEAKFPQNSCNIKKEKQLITEEDVNELHSKGIRVIQNSGNYIITPLAKDRINELGLSLS